MTRLLPICSLFLTALTAVMDAVGIECHGCLMNGKCYRFGESWEEKTEIMCDVRRCIRLNEKQWKVTVQKVFCRQNDGKCVGNSETWPLLKDGECWTRRCKIWEDKRIEIISELAENC